MPTSDSSCPTGKASLPAPPLQPCHSTNKSLREIFGLVAIVLINTLCISTGVSSVLLASSTEAANAPETPTQSSPITNQKPKENELPSLHFGFRSSYQTFYHNSVYALWLEAALAKVGYQSKISWMPNKRIVNLVEHGVLDGNLALAPTSTPKSSKMVQVPEVFFSACFAGYQLKNQKLADSEKNGDSPLKSDGSTPNSPAKIGLLSASEALEAVPKRYWKHPIIQHLPDPQAALRMLQSKRIDYLVVHMPSSQTLQQLYGMELVKSTPILGRFDSYIYLHNSHTALAPALAQALKETRPDSLKHACQKP